MIQIPIVNVFQKWEKNLIQGFTPNPEAEIFRFTQINPYVRIFSISEWITMGHNNINNHS